MKLEFSVQLFEKYSSVDFPSHESFVFSCGRTGMTKLIAAFRNFAKAPQSGCLVKKWLKASMEVDLFLVEVWALP
jgi:hypothetical protein